MRQANSARADLILHNGKVATLDVRKPMAEAVAVRDIAPRPIGHVKPFGRFQQGAFVVAPHSRDRDNVVHRQRG